MEERTLAEKDYQYKLHSQDETKSKREEEDAISRKLRTSIKQHQYEWICIYIYSSSTDILATLGKWWFSLASILSNSSGC